MAKEKVKKTKEKVKTKSKYAKKLLYRKRLSGGKTHVTTNQGHAKHYPLPLPLFQDVDE